MKMVRSLAALSLFSALVLGAPSALADGQRVGVVDVQRAVLQTEDGLRAQANLKKLFENKQAELNKKQLDIQKQMEDLEKQQKVLSKDSFLKRRDELQKQAMDLQGMMVKFNQELQEKQKELTEPIFEKILGIVKRIATTDNLDLVVDRATVAYVRGDLDLTDRCIQMYNSGGGGAAPAPPPAPSGAPAPKK
jgi:outer membrane protein